MPKSETANADLNPTVRSDNTCLTYKDKNELRILERYVSMLNAPQELKNEFLMEEKEAIIIHALNGKLLRAASQGNEKEVKEALELGAYINCKTEFGNTPLILATAQHNPNIVKLLISHPDIYLDAKNRYGDNALKIAERNGDVQIIDSIKHAKQQQTMTYFKLSKSHSR